MVSGSSAIPRALALAASAISVYVVGPRVLAASAPEDDPPAPVASNGEINSDGAADETAPADWWHGDLATGNWFGLRDALTKHGITVESSYSVDAFVPVHGGCNTHDAATFAGLFDLSLSLDTEALKLWKGGTFYFDFQDMRGDSVTDRHVGSLFGVSNLEGPARSQLSEFWYEHVFADNLLRVKVGKQDANADFAFSDLGGEFLNAGPNGIGNVPIPAYPDPAIGAAVFMSPADWITLGAGVYDADGEGGHTGFDTAFHGPDTSFAIYELDLRPKFKFGESSLPGVYKVGGWYHSGEWDVLFDEHHSRLPARTHRGNSGVYVLGEQALTRENSADATDEQGLGAFFQFGWAPSAYNEMPVFYSGGLSYTGLIPGRDDDVTGLGFAHGSLGGELQSLESRYSETALELFHKAQVNKFLSIKPDIQYIFDPGGDGKDAVVVGGRVEISF